MGTSTNQPSPPIPPWQVARAALANQSVTPERQAIELWRAAYGEREGSLLADLGSELLASACSLATKLQTPSDAIRNFQQQLLTGHANNLFLDMGKRALARAVGEKSGASGFAGELFSEVTSYYASRDLPGIVGLPQRAQTTSEIIDLKNQLRSFTKEIVKGAGTAPTDPEGWRSYVTKIVSNLRGQGNT